MDVLFEDVSWIEMPTTFDSLAIVVGLRLDTNAEESTPVNRPGRLAVELRTPERYGLIECHRVSVYTSSYDPGTGEEPSILDILLVESAEAEH